MYGIFEYCKTKMDRCLKTQHFLWNCSRFRLHTILVGKLTSAVTRPFTIRRILQILYCRLASPSSTKSCCQSLCVELLHIKCNLCSLDWGSPRTRASIKCQKRIRKEVVMRVSLGRRVLGEGP